MTSFILVRHGITDWIEQGILHGRTDRPLSPFGREQASLTATALNNIKAVHIYTSPLLRAAQTAQPIGEALHLTPEPLVGLQEMDFGWMEGKTDLWPRVKDKALLVKFYYASRIISCLLSGESPTHFRRRVLQNWDWIRSQNPTGKVIIVAHSGVLRTILLHEFGGHFIDGKRFGLLACSVSEIEADPGGHCRIIKINETTHLNGKGNL